VSDKPNALLAQPHAIVVDSEALAGLDGTRNRFSSVWIGQFQADQLTPPAT
jgi:hypothetical protein